MGNQRYFPPEWYPQSAVQLAWPHAESDWAAYLDEAEACFARIAEEIARREKLIIIAPDISIPQQKCRSFDHGQIVYVQAPTNDTWSRDFGGLTVFEDNVPVICDFAFNGWGLKFAADKDNRITKTLFDRKVFSADVRYQNCLNFILEGGSIESNGKGTILTTGECLLSHNRNGGSDRITLEGELKTFFGVRQVLWLDHGYLSGDDTDSHIDTLARFCTEDTICYVECSDSDDEHFAALNQMKEQLQSFRTPTGERFHLVALPMADPLYFDGERLPATYANFLILNGAVLFPTYKSDKDLAAENILKSVFPDHEIVGIDCTVLVKQHGSLHCVTMQYPKGVME
jgi:agmatine/peptidylarginine deiminase